MEELLDSVDSRSDSGEFDSTIRYVELDVEHSANVDVHYFNPRDLIVICDQMADTVRTRSIRRWTPIAHMKRSVEAAEISYASIVHRLEVSSL